MGWLESNASDRKGAVGILKVPSNGIQQKETDAAEGQRGEDDSRYRFPLAKQLMSHPPIMATLPGSKCRRGQALAARGSM